MGYTSFGRRRGWDHVWQSYPKSIPAGFELAAGDCDEPCLDGDRQHFHNIALPIYQHTGYVLDRMMVQE